MEEFYRDENLKVFLKGQVISIQNAENEMFQNLKKNCMQETSNFDLENQTFTLEDFQKVLEFWSDKARRQHIKIYF